MPSLSSSSGPAIHWIGAGLASGPGIIALTEKWGQITVWDMMLDRANALKEYVAPDGKLAICQLNLDDDTSRSEFCAALNPDDIIISMLPAIFHVRMAKLALAEKCHMVTSSYLTDDMIALNDEAVANGLSIVNEVGLDPGIDHLLTHILVDAARKAGMLDKGYVIDFISYCGGFPVEHTPFTYKFSWTPLGVLTALINPAKLIKDGKEHTVAKAWQDVSELSLNGENFEVYANRNSLPYIAEYGLGEESNLRNFVRGTIRLSGWKKAWKDIFSILEDAKPQDLKKLSDQLWQDHQYKDGECDRVILHASLTATSPDGKIWQNALSLDSTGNGWQSAMATCVSLTVAEAANALMEGRLDSGVQSAPHNIAEAKLWLDGLRKGGIEIKPSS